VADRALIAVCAGCCCGHPTTGGPKTPPRTLKRVIRQRMKAAALDGVARVAFTDCLGPCSEANVVFLFVDGRPIWLRRMNDEVLYDAFFTWLDGMLNNGASAPAALPAALAARSFRWTGGGDGPPPPISDVP
jgi:cobaltochelatase CobN